MIQGFIHMNRKKMGLAAGVLLGMTIVGGTVFAGGSKAEPESFTGGAAIAGFAVPASDFDESDISQVIQSVGTTTTGETKDSPVALAAKSIETAQAQESAEETPASDEPAVDPRTTVLEQYSNLGVVSDVNNYLNVRQEPSTDSEIIGKVLKFGGVEIIQDTGSGWYQISSNEVTGYVSSDFVVVGDEAAALAVEHARPQLMVTADCLNVREEPDIEATILTQVTINERYDIVEELDGWTKITFGMTDDGEEQYGYVSQDYSTTGYYLDEAIEFHPVSAEDKFRQDVVNFALQYLGGRYVWGGTTLGVGVDCSGFMQAVYANFGVYLSRCSYQQVNNGARIDASQMRPGDLVFFSGGGAINHVAMYIGNGQIIHAASPSRGIIISAYNYKTPAAIVNVIGD